MKQFNKYLASLLGVCLLLLATSLLADNIEIRVSNSLSSPLKNVFVGLHSPEGEEIVKEYIKIKANAKGDQIFENVDLNSHIIRVSFDYKNNRYEGEINLEDNEEIFGSVHNQISKLLRKGKHSRYEAYRQ